MKTFLVILVALLLLVAVLPTNYTEGPVILVGGGRIPDRAIELFKENAKSGKFVVVSYMEEHRHKWDDRLNNPLFCLPNELNRIPIYNIAGVLIEGGNQWKYLNEIDAAYLQRIHDRGIPILGTSAGAMILGEHYFSAEKDTITSEQARKNINVCLGKKFVHFKCLADTIVDTHYANRDRRGRLEVFQKMSGAKRAIGIDEQTALFIKGNVTQTIGEGQVSFLPDEAPIATVVGL